MVNESKLVKILTLNIKTNKKRIIKKKFVHSKVPSGKEICQNQLMHLIDKVNSIEVKQSEIENFLPSIYEKLEGLSREELIQKLEEGMHKGITATANGFYGPQGRSLRLAAKIPNLNEQLNEFNYNGYKQLK